MSASREKKARQEQVTTGFTDARTQREREEQAKARRSNIMYIAIAVVFVLVAIVVIVANSKVIERNAKAVTIGNETYTAADVDYYYYTAYNSFVRNYSSYLSMYGLDTSKSLKDQDCPMTDGGTWYDYFRDQAISSLTSYSLLAQKAEEDGFDGSETVEADLKQVYSDLDSYAAAAGYPRSQYIKTVCGPLVNKAVFERNVRLTSLAQAYSAEYANSLEYSDDEVQAELVALRKQVQDRAERAVARVAGDHVVVVDDQEELRARPPVALGHPVRGDLGARHPAAHRPRRPVDRLLGQVPGDRVAEPVGLVDRVEQFAAQVDEGDPRLFRRVAGGDRAGDVPEQVRLPGRVVAGDDQVRCLGEVVPQRFEVLAGQAQRYPELPGRLGQP